MRSLQSNLSMDDIEEEYCHAIFTIEHELGHFIDDTYPLVKFWEEITELKWYEEQQKKANEGF